MADWLIRATKQHITSSSPRSMEAQFGGSFVDDAGKAISNATAIPMPDLSAVAGFESRYWITNTFPDDAVTLMSQSGRDDLDAELEDARKDQLEELFANDPAFEVTRELINVERAARSAVALTPAEYRANYRANL